MKSPAPVIRSYAALCGTWSCGLMLLFSGSELQSQTNTVERSSAGASASSWVAWASARSRLNASRWVLTNRNLVAPARTSTHW